MFSPKIIFSTKQKNHFLNKNHVLQKYSFSIKKKYPIKFTRKHLFGPKWFKIVQTVQNAPKGFNMVILILNSMGWPIY